MHTDWFQQQDTLQQVRPSAQPVTEPVEGTTSEASLEEETTVAVPQEKPERTRHTYQELQQLPPNATPAQLDSAIQSVFRPEVKSLATPQDTLLLSSKDSIQEATDINFSKYYKEGFFTNNALLHPELNVERYGEDNVAMMNKLAAKAHFVPIGIDQLHGARMAPVRGSIRIATGVQHSVREFASLAFKEAGIDVEFKGEGLGEKGYDKATGKVVIEVSPDFYRPTDVVNLWGDPSKAKRELGWNPQKTSFEELVALMVRHDMEKVAVERAGERIRMNLAEYLEKGVVK